MYKNKIRNKLTFIKGNEKWLQAKRSKLVNNSVNNKVPTKKEKGEVDNQFW